MKEQGNTAASIKQLNKRKIYEFIYAKKQTYKQQIIEELHLSISTVTQNLSDLEKEGFIRRNGFLKSVNGRKAKMIEIIPDAKISIGVSITKEQLYFAAVDLYGEAVASDMISLTYTNDSSYYDDAVKAIVHFIEEHNYQPEQIRGVSFAVMRDFQISLSDFSTRLLYPCHMEYNSEAAACFELWSHPTLDHAVVLLLNHHIGSAIITNRQIFKGIHHHSGSIEHLCINPEGPSCSCGKRGCFETYCSISSLEESAGMTVEDFFAQLKKHKDFSILQIWENYLEHLAFAIRNITMIIDAPVIIGGFLAPYFTSNVLDYLLSKINAVSPFPMERKNLMTGVHGAFTPAIGAALFYVSQTPKYPNV